jgi:hypothetical protein
LAATSLQDTYVRLLLDRVRGESFPNPDHLDRIEASLRTPGQLRDYLEVLLDKANTKRPSPDLLDRIQGFAELESRHRKRT